MAERDDGGVRIRTTVLVAVVATALGWILLRELWVDNGWELPLSPWLAVVLLLLMAACVLAAGLDIWRYQQGRATQVPSPQRARATLVAAQASALGGAVVVGWYAAQALVLLPNADVESVRSDLIRAVVLALAAAVLVAAGLAAQAMCRIPPDDEDDDRRGRGTALDPLVD